MNIIEAVKQLFYHRWNLPVLVAFIELGGKTRFFILGNKLEISRGSLKSSLVALVELGFIEKNSGYGHPLRPEYVITPIGEEVAKVCLELIRLSDGNEVLFRKWTAPLLLCLLDGQTRYNRIRLALNISPRALTQALRQLEASGLVSRQVEDGYPPGTSYNLIGPGLVLAQQLESLKNLIPNSSIQHRDAS